MPQFFLITLSPLQFSAGFVLLGISFHSHKHVLSLQFHPTTSTTTMYVPPIIFYPTAHLVPHFVHVADLFCAGAGFSGHYCTPTICPPTICPPTSVYSLFPPLLAVVPWSSHRYARDTKKLQRKGEADRMLGIGFETQIPRLFEASMDIPLCPHLFHIVYILRMPKN